MPKLIYLDSAKSDLINIARYIATESGSRAVARSFVGKLRERCRLLISPGASQRGTDRSELLAGIRSVVHGNYVIFFRYESSDVVIVNIIEGHRDIESVLRGDDI